MKNNQTDNRLKKVFAPALVLTTFLISFNAQALQQRGSVGRLFNACEQELDMYCSRLSEPREVVMCLRQNEPQLRDPNCIEEMRLINRDYNNVPLPTEEPFRTDDGGQLIQ